MKRLDEFKKRKGAEEDPEDPSNDDAGIVGGRGGGLGGNGGEAGGGNASTRKGAQGGGGVALGGSAFDATKATSEVGDGRESKVRATEVNVGHVGYAICYVRMTDLIRVSLSTTSPSSRKNPNAVSIPGACGTEQSPQQHRCASWPEDCKKEKSNQVIFILWVTRKRACIYCACVTLDSSGSSSAPPPSNAHGCPVILF